MNSLTNNCFDLVTTFCIFDDLVNMIFPKLYKTGRPRALSLSEIATICLIRTRYKINNLYALYLLLVTKFSSDFTLPTYKNFVSAMNDYAPYLLTLINILLSFNNKRSGTIKIVDSTPIPVCKNIRISSHKVMKKVATRSKSTMGWYYGLKLHLLIDLKNTVLAIKFTTANVGDRKVLNRFLDDLKNSIILADAGYLSPALEKKAWNKFNILLTPKRGNMKRISTLFQNFLLNFRSRIESVFSVLKERLGLITSLPRSVKGYYSHLIRTIFSYMFQSLLAS